jgi:hypothetical protein
MVVIINNQEEKDAIMRICTTMFNIERNKTLFDEECKFINSNEPYNKYEIDDVIINCTMSMGYVVLYTAIHNIVAKISTQYNQLIEINNISDIDQIPINIFSNTNTTYTSITNRSVLRRCINLKKYKKSNVDFNWTIIVETPFLELSEIDNACMATEYLNVSMSTIIYDDKTLLNVPTMYKSINYPSIDLYNIYVNNKLLNGIIDISERSGLSFEITKAYYPDAVYRNISERPFQVRNIDEFKINSFDESTAWYDNIKNAPNGDIVYKCFVTGLPLYEYALLFVLTSETYTYHILISPNMIYLYSNLTLYFTKYKFEVQYVYKVNINIKEHEVIQNLPERYPLLKKNIMYSMSKNGITFLHVISKRILYAYDLIDNFIYMGFNCICDMDIIRHYKANTLLFVYNII